MRRSSGPTRTTLEAMARTIRRRWPGGIDRAELCMRHGINVSTWRTAGYESQLFVVARDVYRDPRSTVYHTDPERTQLLARIHVAETPELRAELADQLVTPRPLQRTLEVQEEP
ncbi:MAG: hypothetical protein L3J96_07135 [Thermoplasmata archaeon]|nr:hypothetical protein [Thermoplasmata archaeon]